ncbi:MAG: transcription elongation factor GreA, partial [Spirochaetota bacterium]
DYEWLHVSHQVLALQLFRFLKPLVKVEEKGTKMKNSALDILFGSKNVVIKRIIEEAEYGNLRKIYALFKEVPYITDTEKDKLYNLITELRPDFNWEDNINVEETDEEDVSSLLPSSGVMVTKVSYNKRKEEFDHLVNVEMPANSRDIGEAQEKGDLRENAEYKAAMEKQVQLQAAIKKLEADIKNATIIDLPNVKTDRITIGCKVKLQNVSSQEEISYSILGPWDADTTKGIISYQSPLGMSLLGKKVGDEAKLDFDNSHTTFQVLEISRYSN